MTKQPIEASPPPSEGVGGRTCFSLQSIHLQPLCLNRLKDALSDVPGISVDLSTSDAPHSALKGDILRKALHVSHKNGAFISKTWWRLWDLRCDHVFFLSIGRTKGCNQPINTLQSDGLMSFIVEKGRCSLRKESICRGKEGEWTRL